MHATHRSAENQAQMIHAEALLQQALLREHHIVVIVLRKFCAQAIAGFAGLPVADAVGQHDVVALGIQRLAGAEQHIGKDGPHQAFARATGAVQ